MSEPRITGYALYHAYIAAMTFPALGMVPDPITPDAWEEWSDSRLWNDAARRLNIAMAYTTTGGFMTDRDWADWYGRAPRRGRPWWAFWR